MLYLTIYSFVRLTSIHPPVSPSIHSAIRPFICLHVHPPVNAYICPYIYPSTSSPTSNTNTAVTSARLWNAHHRGHLSDRGSSIKAPFVMTDCCLDVFPSVLPAALFPVSQELTCTEDTGVMCCNSFVHPGKPAGDQPRRIRIFIPFAPSWKVRPTLPEKNQTTRYHFPVFCLPYCNLPVQGKTVPTSTTVNVRRKTQVRWFFPGTAPAPALVDISPEAEEPHQ